MTGDGPPVIVVGAGPVGLVAALRLASSDLPVLLLEKRDGINRASRASTFHPPTLEILDRLGVLSDLLPLGVRVSSIQFRDLQGMQAELDLGQLGTRTRFPFRFHLEQAVVGAHLLERLVRIPNFTLLHHAAVRDLEIGEDRVRVTYKDEVSGEVGVRDGSFVIAADGAGSRVRERIGIGMPGRDYEAPMLRIFFRQDLRSYLPGLAPVTYLFAGEDSCSLLEMPGGWRAILRLSPDTLEGIALSRGFQLARLSRFLPVGASALDESSADLYRSSLRLAETNQAAGGRVLLMGDAVHLTNTRGGMNMNCGIHDADAIAGALVRSLREGSRGPLVECARKRLRVAREMLLPRTDGPVAAPPAWLQAVRTLASDPDASLDYLVRASMLDMV